MAISLNGASAHAAKKSAALTPVTMIAQAKLAGIAPIQLGKDRGFFRKEGLSLNIRYDIPAPQLASTILTGRAQFAAFSWISLITLGANNLPLVGVANFLASGKTAQTDDPKIVVLDTSPIRTVKDLKGKTVGTPLLRGLAELSVRYSALQAGLQQSDVKFAVAPDVSALTAGRVDAVVAVEPFFSQLASQTKVRVVAGTGAALVRGGELPSSLVVTSRAYLGANKAIADKFRRATNRSVAYARTHRAQMRKYLLPYTKLPASVVNRLTLPNWQETTDFRKLDRYVTIATNFGFIPKKVNPRTLIVTR